MAVRGHLGGTLADSWGRYPGLFGLVFWRWWVFSDNATAASGIAPRAAPAAIHGCCCCGGRSRGRGSHRVPRRPCYGPRCLPRSGSPLVSSDYATVRR